MAGQSARTALKSVIAAVAREYGIDPELALAVAHKESGTNQSRIGDGGKAVGIFQLHPGAARDVGSANRADPFDNIVGGVKYLKLLLDRYQGDTRRALVAYNGGMGNVDRGTTSQQAQAYADDIMARVTPAAAPLAQSPAPPAAAPLAAQSAPPEAAAPPAGGRPEIFRLSNGQQVRMPADWSDDQVADVLGQMETDAASTHEAPDAPPPADEPQAPDSPTGRFLSSLGAGLNPVRMISGLAQTVAHPYDTLIKPAVDRLPTVPGAIREGRFTDAANAVAGSVPILGPASEEISGQWKGGDVAGAMGSMTALVAAPKIFKDVGGGLKAVGRQGARLAIDAPAVVRETALRERALPGLLRGGASRTASRVASAERQLGRAIEPVKHTPAVRRNVTFAPKAWDTIQGRFNTAPGVSAARRVVAQVPGSPTVLQLFQRAKGAFPETVGSTKPAAVMERALAENAVKEIGRAAPSTARAASRYGSLQEVAQAYGKPSPELAPGMMPTFEARLAAAAGHRLAGPAAQSVYNVGRAVSLPPAVTTALAANRERQQGQRLPSLAPASPEGEIDPEALAIEDALRQQMIRRIMMAAH